ncbi:RHS repeat-associated core domain-containing protein, partial [Ekhidna sp.]|uniref:RHS repeat domain-containing protein n=1 Tax=Ekhidna sp. TaxID=2608089 RepID=UPI003299E5BB
SAAKSTGPNTSETLSIDDIIADQEGYILAYLSNENQEAFTVHFDDFTVYHGKTNVVSTQDYYPFGLTFNESSRVASKEQRFKYNSFEYIPELQWTDYGARMYDAAIGRWNGIDPLSDKYRLISPYSYVANNPLSYIDIDGRDIKNPDKYVISNKKFIRKLKQFDRALAKIAGVNKSSYSLIITGGDRYRKNGNILSKTNDDPIPQSDPDSFHLQENGATGIDFRKAKFSDEQLKAAAEEVGLQFQGGYNDKHFHLESEDSEIIDSYKNDQYADKDYVPSDYELNNEEDDSKESANNESDPKQFLFNQFVRAASTGNLELAQILADQLNEDDN